MPTQKASKPPPPLRTPATRDHLRKARTISQYVAFCPEDIPEPEAPRLGAPEEQREAYKAAVNDWQAEVDEKKVQILIQSMGRKAYRALIEAHPPTPEQVAKAKKDGTAVPDNNVETFPPALIAQSIKEPEGVTEEDVAFMWAEWPQGEIESLAQMCLALNQTSRLEFHQSKSGTTRD